MIERNPTRRKHNALLINGRLVASTHIWVEVEQALCRPIGTGPPLLQEG